MKQLGRPFKQTERNNVISIGLSESTDISQRAQIFFFDIKALLLMSFSSLVVSSLLFFIYTNGIITIAILNNIIEFFLVCSYLFIVIESCYELLYFYSLQSLLKININGISQPLQWSVSFWLHWSIHASSFIPYFVDVRSGKFISGSFD